VFAKETAPASKLPALSFSLLLFFANFNSDFNSNFGANFIKARL